MESGFLAILLALFTLLALVVTAINSKHKAERRMVDDNATKSTLAAGKAPNRKPADVK